MRKESRADGKSNPISEAEEAVSVEEPACTDRTRAAEISSELGRLQLQSAIIDRLAILSETDVRGVITHVNDNFCRVSGYSREELVGRTHAIVNSGFHPKSFWKDMFATMAKGGIWQKEVRNRAKDGSHYWVHCINTAIRDADGKLRGYMSLRMDITASKNQQALLRVQNLKLDAALEHMSQGLVMFDNHLRLVMCNDKYAQMYSLPPKLCEPGTPLTEILDHYLATELYEGGLPSEYAPDKLSSASLVAECVHKLTNGRSIRVLRRRTENGSWVSTHEDITHRIRLENRIAHLALYDSLTNLPNRTLLRCRLEQALACPETGGVAVLCLDLDRFKEVNDTLGHGVGDALLQAVAKRLKSCVRSTDTVARVGGDEFVIVQRSADPRAESAALSERIFETVTAPYDLCGHHVMIGVSIGIAHSPRDGTDQEALLQHADLALYRSKAVGRGAYNFFEQAMNDQVQARRALERDLRNALVNDEFELHYQPIHAIQSNAVVACEALLRWRHPDQRLIAPSEFIHVAEDIGLISAIGEWALRRACSDALRWPATIKVAVNFSAAQFKSPTLPATILSALHATGLPPGRLEIEITESLLLEDSETVLANLQAIHRLGASVILDDFGAGYSSLRYLRTFRFDKIKVDRCFIQDLTAGKKSSQAIVRAIVSIARELGMVTVAEGVETELELRHVRDSGLEEVQGFLFSRPLAAADLLRVLAESNAESTAAVA